MNERVDQETYIFDFTIEVTVCINKQLKLYGQSAGCHSFQHRLCNNLFTSNDINKLKIITSSNCSRFQRRLRQQKRRACKMDVEKQNQHWNECEGRNAGWFRSAECGMLTHTSNVMYAHVVAIIWSLGVLVSLVPANMHLHYSIDFSRAMANSMLHMHSIYPIRITIDWWYVYATKQPYKSFLKLAI